MFLLVVIAIFVYDVAYDIVYDIQKIAMLHTICNMHIAIIRYRTSISYTYRYYTISYVHIAKKHTMLPCNVAYYCSYKYLDWRLRRVALVMPLERPQVLPHDPRPSQMICTAS